MTDFATLVLASDTRGLTNAQRELNALTKTGSATERNLNRATGAMSAGFTRVAAAAGAMAGALLAGISARAIISGISDFETSMSKVAAVTRATESELIALRDIAQQLGQTTEFTAGQAADGLAFLGMAGFTAAESIAAIPAVLDLATASGMGLAEAADTASNIMSGFAIEAGNAGDVADVLAAASSRANTNVGQLGQAMSTVAPISAALGIDLADTAAAIGVLSDAGIQGERAGTALRGVMAALAGPTTGARDALAQYGLTAADVNPETTSLAEVMTRLQKAGISTADAMTIFGREAASGALVLTAASARLGEFGEELRDVDGAAQGMANTMRDNLGGDLDGLQSSLGGLILVLGDAGAEGALRSLVQGITSFIRGASLMIGQVSDIVGAFQRLYSEQARVEAQIDNTRIALNDEARALANLEPSMRAGASMSVTMAQQKLREAMSRRENIAAIADEQRALAMQTSEYTDLSKEIEYLTLQSRNLANTERDGGQFAPQANRADIEFQIDQLDQLAAARARLLDPSGDLNKVLRENDRVIEQLSNGLENAVDGMVTFEGTTITTTEATDRLNTALEEVSSSGAPAVTREMEKLTDEQKRLQEASRQVEGAFGQAFTGIITGASSAKDALGQLLSQLANMWANAAFKSLFGGMFGSGGPLSFLVPSFDGGGYTGSAARSGGLDGKGGFMAMLHPNETVVDHTKGQPMAGAGGEPIQVVIHVQPSGEFDARVQNNARAVVRVETPGMIRDGFAQAREARIME